MSDTTSPDNKSSSQDFQRKLFEWFEKRGLLSELRAFMRHRMISALYSSESPCPAAHPSNLTAVSPTLQAFLLLVAEFLVQQEFHYTMSVMVAEAPLLASFPKFSGYVSYLSQANASATMRSSDFPRYSAKDVQEILEVLGMTSDSECVEHILRLYSNNNARESLLACVLTALSVMAQSSSQETYKQYKSIKNDQRKSAASGNATQWIEEIRLVLLRAQLTSHQLQQVEDLLRNLQSDTANRARQEENERNCKINHIHEQELLAKALIQEEKFRAEIQEAEEDLRSKQKHLELVTVQLRQQHDEVLNRLNRVQRHADEIKRQENEVAEREKALEKKQALLEDEHRTLIGLRSELQEATHSLRQEQSGAKTILELNRLQERCLHLESELKETKDVLMTSSVCRVEMGVQATELAPKLHKIPAVEHQENHVSSGSSYSSSMGKPSDKERSSQVSLLKRVLCRVQQENSELRAIAVQQRKRIDELTNRASQLANHLVDQATAQSSPATALGSQRLPPHPLSPPHVQSQIAADNPKMHSNTHSFLTQSGKHAQRKSPKRHLQNVNLTSSFSSDESPTEEILQEAKNRLKQLELESEAADRSYRDFQARQVDSRSANIPLYLPQKDPGQTNLMQNSISDGTMHCIQTSPAAPSWQQRSPFLETHSGQLATPSKPGSFHCAPKISAGLSSVTPTFQKFHYSPMFSRSAYSFPRVNTLSRLPSSYSSLPSRSSVFRRPIDRLRNLLGGQSHSAYSRDINEERDKFIEPKGGILTSHLRSSGSDRSPNKASYTAMTQQIDDTGTVYPTAPCETFASSDQDKLPGIKKEKQVSVSGGPPEEKEVVEVDNQQQNNLQVSDDEVKTTRGRKDSQVKSVHLQPSVNEAEDTVNNIRNDPRDTSKFPSHEENVVVSTEKQVVPHHDTVEEIPIMAQSLSAEEPQSPNFECPSPAGAAAKSAADLHNPENHAIKSNTLDATLNEISTLSSSPGISSVHATNVKTKITESYFADLQASVKADKLHSSLILADDRYNNNIDTEVQRSVDGLSQSLKEIDNFEENKASQLLHTSLSSIENGDLLVSAGSEGKKTDDDDDFW